MENETQQLAKIKAPPLKRFLLLLLSILIAMSIFTALVISFKFALALLYGGLISILGHVYFAWYAFRYRGAKHAQLIWKGFTKGQAGRFSIIVIGFCLIFQLLPTVEVIPLFVSFIGFYFISLFLGARILV